MMQKYNLPQHGQENQPMLSMMKHPSGDQLQQQYAAKVQASL